MTNLVQKVEALAEKVGADADKLWHEFEAFVEGKSQVEVAAKDESEGSTKAAPGDEGNATDASTTSSTSTETATESSPVPDAEKSTEAPQPDQSGASTEPQADSAAADTKSE